LLVAAAVVSALEARERVGQEEEVAELILTEQMGYLPLLIAVVVEVVVDIKIVLHFQLEDLADLVS
jgi:hypothetical protein